MVRSRWQLASAALAALSLLGCSETLARTQLMLVADSDIAELDTIRFEVGGDGETQTAETRDLASGPATLALVPRGSKLGPLRVTARGLRAGDTLVERSAEVSFVAHQTRVVELHLLASCVGVRCSDTETCGAQGCEPRARSSDELTPWDGDAPGLDIQHEDAGATADAGGDLDAGVSMDADVTASDPDGAADAADAAPFDSDAEAGQGVNCGGDATQVDLATDVNHCGMCGNICRATARNTVAVCTLGVCQTQCRSYFGDCDANPNNGCEQSLFVTGHCGMCGNACGTGQVCRLGSCF